MSLNPDIRDQAYQFFIEEAQELLQVLEDGLLHLKEDHSTPKVHELMRAAHSIKGGAASVELHGIKKLAHRLEDFFKALYSDTVEFDDHLESLLLQGYDCLRNPLNEQIATGTFDEELALTTAEPIFEQLAEILAEALQEGESYIPSATDLGVDIVASIFEIDVAQSLEHLLQVLSNPEDFDVAEELQTQIEVLTGFAELFHLSGFNEIIDLANQVVTQNPDNALEITKIIVADCQAARTAILAGDRDRGGEPSAELLALASGNSAMPDYEAATGEETIALDDVFGGDFAAVTASEDGEATLSNIFGVSGNLAEPVTHNLAAEESEPLPSLDEVFGETVDILSSADSEMSGFFENIDSQSEEQIIEQTKFSAEELPSSDNDSEPEEFAPPENLEAAIQSVEEIFDRLPEIEAVPIITPELYPPSSPPTISQKPKQAQVASNLTVRVDLDRLERMNNLIGELIINRNSLSLQNEQLQNNVQDLITKFTSFRSLTSNLREFSDQILVETETNSANSASMAQDDREGCWGFPHSRTSPSIPALDSCLSTETAESALSRNRGVELAEFDSLEMDRYGQLHLLLQEILEEILQLEEGVDDIALFAQQSDRTINLQRQMLGQMRDEMMWARMLPLEQILQRFPRTLRDLSNKYKKPVKLKMVGTGVLVDKAVLEKLYDPLLHLLRNAFDHGIEHCDLRQQRGKSESGQIDIHAYYQGNQTVIEIRDDGEGLNVQKIAKKAIKKGMISASEASSFSNERLFDLIFEPGFSTAEQVSEVSGRGVGMNVVRSQIEQLKGSITVHSISGQGTTFTLRLPLTLTIAKLLVFALSQTAFAIPSDSIAEIIIPLPEQLKLSGTQRFLFWENNLVPIYSLDELLEYNCQIATNQTSSKAFESVAAPKDWALPLLILRRGQQFFALEIKRLISEEELVIKPFSQVIKAPLYTYGCTILGDGTLIPVLNGATLIDEFLGVTTNTGTTSSERTLDLDLDQQDLGNLDSLAQSPVIKIKTIMVVDDSTALRRTMALSLEKQGYKVFQAKDGRDAVEQFRKISELDLIVCDIEMPNMNGFEFLGVRRRDSVMKEVPVIMLTSRSGNKHRNLATQLGADGYFTKPYVEQEFLKELNKILQEKQNKTSKQTLAAPKASNNITILVIDDSSSLRRTMTLSLQNQGYRVLQARDGQEGLAQMRNNPQIALAICDLEMPNVNGFELLTTRFQEPTLRKIPVAILTSSSGDKHRNLAQQLGANAYFSKPYVEQELLSGIKNLIKIK
ncbi:MAG: response regulator [Xenococcus sp. (in: cyanobacteria)]